MIVAAADAAQHGTEMPRMVAAAVQYGDIPDGGLDMPAGLPNKLRYYRNVYRAFEAYKASAGSSVAWTNANPQAWELVSAVIALRMELRDG